MGQRIGWCLGFLLLTGVMSAHAAAPSAATTVAVESVKGKDGAPMILISAGPFLMGSNDGLPNERPEHTVTVKSFYIDQYEVTAGRYQKFLELGKRESAMPADDEAGRSLDDRPVVGVTVQEAVVAIEPDTEGPCVERARRRAIVARREVPLARSHRAPAGVPQDAGERRSRTRQTRGVARVAGRHVAEEPHPHRMVVAAGEQRRPGR